MRNVDIPLAFTVVWKVDTKTDITSRITRAAYFAATRHVHQRRKGMAQEPYVNHLVEVANLLAQAVGDEDVNLIVAGLLHDTIEDVGVSQEDLAELFGQDVAALVAEVTDDKTLEKAVRKQLQIEHAPHMSVRAQWLKIADKISNLRSMRDSPPAGWDAARVARYVAWAKAVVDALSQPHRELKREFETLHAEMQARLAAGAPPVPSR